MTETATEQTTIAAPPSHVWAVAIDVERYPEWVRDIKEASIVDRDAEGRPAQVEFRAAAIGRSTHYTLAYDYTDAPAVMSWSMVKGDLQKRIDGSYHFSEAADGGTDVRYDLLIELIVPLPGFVKRRAEVRILNTLKELKQRAEATWTG